MWKELFPHRRQMVCDLLCRLPFDVVPFVMALRPAELYGRTRRDGAAAAAGNCSRHATQVQAEGFILFLGLLLRRLHPPKSANIRVALPRQEFGQHREEKRRRPPHGRAVRIEIRAAHVHVADPRDGIAPLHELSQSVEFCTQTGGWWVGGRRV
eukprot:COSAG04_NODE_10134_length_801_cov_1.911681_1_plen_153_part_10